jgi:hypothetical protein
MGSPLLKAAQSAIKAAGSLGATKSVTLRRASSTYVPATGVSTPTNTDYTWTVVQTFYSDRMVDGTSVKSGDRKLLGAAADLSVTPNPETDAIVMDSLTWQIVDTGTQTDPATATWTLQVRR